MKYLFKNLKPYWRSVLILAVFLVIQGFCEMSMPQYTQNIIDVGIQDKGIGHILPSRITEKEYGNAQLFMDDSQKREWQDAYTKSGKTYSLKELGNKQLDELDEDLLTPLVLSYQLEHMTAKDLRSMMKGGYEAAAGKAGASPAQAEASAAQAGASAAQTGASPAQSTASLSALLAAGLTDDQIKAIKSQAEKLAKAAGSRTIRAMGIRYAADAAREAGVDVDRIQTSYLWKSGGKMLLVALFMGLAAAVVSYIASRVGAGVGRDLRRKVFGNVIGYSNAEMDHFQTSSLITRATNDVQQVQMVTTMMLRMVLYAPVLCVWGIVKVWQARADMNWVIILSIAVIFTVMGTLVFIAMPRFRSMQKLVDRLNGVSREILTGLLVIRAFGREKTEEKRFDDANTDLMRTQLFTNRVMTFMMPAMMFLMSATGVLITWVASHRVDSGLLQVGAMTSFITYSMIIISSFMILTAMSIMLPRAGVAAERIDEVMRTKSSVLSPEKPVQAAESRGVITYDHVSFRYPGADGDALKDISFTVRPGQTTAIIGSTGSGKSTLVSLIPRFYDVTEGSIAMDGVDIRDMDLHRLRDMIGFVPQKGTLFSGTIASNIRFGNPDASDEEVARAARVSQSEDFILEKPEGYGSYISQGGSNVSGGQKQRLSIARAIAKKPKVLVFDDSFSALDMKTDAKLRSELEVQEKDAAKVIVAQRVSTILRADQIIVLDEGHIAGIGTHKDLLDACEVYRQIAASQLSEKELEATRHE